MPYLYEGPEDSICSLRGVPEEAEAEAQAFWDGSKDRWVTHVLTSVAPDNVASVLHTSSSRSPIDKPIPKALLRKEADENIR